MSEDLKEVRDMLKKLVDSNQRIELALFGDSDIGVTGVVKRLGAVEGKQRAADRSKVYFLGMMAGASAVASLAVNYLIR